MPKTFDNQEFISIAKSIRNTEGISYESIAEAAGIKYSRFSNILYNRTEAKKSDLNALKSVTLVPSESEIDRLIAENEDLKRQVWEALKDKEFQQGTIDRLLKIIEGDKLKE